MTRFTRQASARPNCPEPDGAPNYCSCEAPRRTLGASSEARIKMIDTFLRMFLAGRRRGGRRSLKWALVWTAVAILAGPAIGKIMDEQGK